MIKDKKVYALVTAAGKGSRMGLKTNKQFLKIGKMTVLERTLKKVLSSSYIDKVLLILPKNKMAYASSLIGGKDKDRLELIPGGASREESTYCGLKRLKGKKGLVLCHDGARPFVSTELIDQAIEKAYSQPGLITAVKEIDTVKRVKNGRVVRDLDRSELVRVQTPQVFDIEKIIEAYERAPLGEKFTDDSSYLTAMGENVLVLFGSYDNIKITTQEDLKVAELLAREEDSENW